MPTEPAVNGHDPDGLLDREVMDTPPPSLKTQQERHMELPDGDPRVLRWARIKGEGLPTTERHLFQELAHYVDPHTGEAFPSQDTLMVRTGMGKTTVSTRLKLIEAIGGYCTSQLRWNPEKRITQKIYRYAGVDAGWQADFPEGEDGTRPILLRLLERLEDQDARLKAKDREIEALRRELAGEPALEALALEEEQPAEVQIPGGAEGSSSSKTDTSDPVADAYYYYATDNYPDDMANWPLHRRVAWFVADQTVLRDAEHEWAWPKYAWNDPHAAIRFYLGNPQEAERQMQEARKHAATPAEERETNVKKRPDKREAHRRDYRRRWGMG